MSVKDDFFLLGAVTAASKTLQAPLERVKLLVQCQMDISSRLHTAIAVVQDAHGPPQAASLEARNARAMLKLVLRSEERPFLTLFRGNLSNVVRYVPSQLALLSVRDFLNDILLFDRELGYKKWLWSNVLSGGLSGVFSQLAAHPFDVVRTRMAVDIGSKQNSGFEHKNSRELLKKLVRTNGVRSLYTGLLITIGGVFLFRSIYFALFDVMVDIIQPRSVLQQLAIGWWCSFIGTVVAYPFDTVRRRMICGLQLNVNGSKEYRNAWHCFERIIGREGFSALFRGSSVNVVRHVAGAAVLVGYDTHLAIRRESSAPL